MVTSGSYFPLLRDSNLQRGWVLLYVFFIFIDSFLMSYWMLPLASLFREFHFFVTVGHVSPVVQQQLQPKLGFSSCDRLIWFLELLRSPKALRKLKVRFSQCIPCLFGTIVNYSFFKIAPDNLSTLRGLILAWIKFRGFLEFGQN